MIFAAAFGAVHAEAGTITASLPLKATAATKSKTIGVGDNIKLRLIYGDVTLYGANASIKSSKPSVASVSDSGVVTGKNPGTAYVSISYKKKYAKLKVTVKGSSAEEEGDAEYEPIEDESASELSSAEAALRSRIVTYAKSFVGILPYVHAGDSLTSGTDCSGFTCLIYAKFGMDIPRSAREYQGLCNIQFEELLPGDIVVYKNGGHVAMYIGNEQVVHCKGSAYGTCIDSMWYGTPTGYVRFIG
ncbi:MAG: NlpC/P60 family protein [Lachnospiraceae bacterium]|nr:NlpC/P60 family protein [Lachnospiraceae bacterium]